MERQGGRLLRGALFYVLGFTVVFVALGVGAGSLGHGVRQSGGPVQRVGGVVTGAAAPLLLGVVVAALAVAATPGLARRLARAAVPVSVVGGVLLAVLGLTLLLGRYDVVSGWLARLVPA